MTLTDIVAIMQNRLITLGEARKASYSAGDLERVVKIDGDLVTTNIVVQQLQDLAKNNQ